MSIGFKFCKTCNVDHPLTAEFWPKNKDRFAATCKIRKAQQHVEFKNKNPDIYKLRKMSQNELRKSNVRAYDMYLTDDFGNLMKYCSHCKIHHFADYNSYEKRSDNLSKLPIGKCKVFLKERNRSELYKAKRRPAIRKYLSENVNAKLSYSIRSRIRSAVLDQKTYKLDKTECLIGCSISELKSHLEFKFTNGMSWDNYGKWHIDHIIPLSAFDLSNKEHQMIAFNYKNLQPLWAEDNLKKSNKVSKDFDLSLMKLEA